MAELQTTPEVVVGALRMTADHILLRPLEWTGKDVHGEGAQIEVIRHGRALRGEVMAVGPGTNPVSKRRKSADGNSTIIDYSRRFRPTEVKVGDVVEIGGLNIFDGLGYQFPEVVVNGTKCIIVTERDIAGVRA